MPVAAEIRKHIAVPDGVKVDYDTKTGILTITGPLGTLSRKFMRPNFKFEYKDNKISFSCKFPRRKDNSLLGTWEGHVKNMILGVTTGFEYKMKTVFSHFPVKTSVEGNEFVIQNFLGERSARKAKILDGVAVEVKGDDITIQGVDKEKVGQTAANIERATAVKNRDVRVFQDGVYQVSKGGR